MTTTSNTHPILAVRNLVKHYPVRGGVFSRRVASVKAVQDVSCDLKEGETLGLVGESGCGKSTLGRTLLRLEDATAGEVLYRGTDLLRARRSEIFRLCPNSRNHNRSMLEKPDIPDCNHCVAVEQQLWITSGFHH